ncbi:MAG: hypothetical protein WCT99_13135 [Bacteroidota bacterium]
METDLIETYALQRLTPSLILPLSGGELQIPSPVRGGAGWGQKRKA